MLTMAFDTSTRAASVAVGDSDRLIGEMMTDIKLKHSERLMFLCDDLLRNLGMKIGDIELFAVTAGPGSFTGLRIAMAAVKGLAQPKDIPIAPVSSLECCALGQNASPGDIICPMFDAQRSSVYAAFFREDGGRAERLTEDSVRDIGELADEIKASGLRTVICGDGVYRFREMLGTIPNAVIASPARLLPKASSLIAPAVSMYEEGKCVSYRDVMPVYLRRPQAEEAREMREAGC